jgi:gliding motility-associated-like protein
LDTEVNFQDESEGRGIVEYEWNFAGLGNSTEQNPKYVLPEESGRYPIKLRVTTNKNCSDEYVQSITVGDRYFMYIPSSFTPNGDGKNDTWKPEGTGIESGEYYLRVFDRWGQLLFESRDPKKAWDGRAMQTGEMVANGVYVYRLITGDEENNRQRHEEYGNVTIIK